MRTKIMLESINTIRVIKEGENPVCIRISSEAKIQKWE